VKQGVPLSGPVVVTGAARGLGRAIALALVDEGCEPILMGRSAASLEETAHAVAAGTGGPARQIVADVADWAAVVAAVESALRSGERLGGLVNNAGIIDPIAKIDESDPAAFARCIAVNLLGPYHIMRACLPQLAGGGVVVNISSGAAAAEHAGWGAYAASKAGLERLSATLAAERPDLVVVAVRPGITDTGMQAEIKASRVDNAVRRIPLADMQPAEVPARAIARFIARRPGAGVPRVVEARALEESG